jgi:predicted RNA-binding Zn ribbon-like protein
VDLGEYLNNYQDLIDWNRHIKTITAAEAKTLSAAAAKHPAKADKAHRGAIELREMIYSIFCSTVEDMPPDEKDMTAFNKKLSKAMMHSQIYKTQNGFDWDITGNKAELDWILNPVIRSAADLLVSEELDRLKKCADPNCGWLFLDISRNHSRRWCDMRDCGNRAKANRFYKKKKPARPSKIPTKVKPSPSTSNSNLDRHLL